MCITAMEYPKDLLQIQVLDDSDSILWKSGPHQGNSATVMTHSIPQIKGKKVKIVNGILSWIKILEVEVF